MISQIINKRDSFEIVRDKIAAILKTNIENQHVLYVTEGLDPSPWDIRVFSERNNPWEEFQYSEGASAPIVNVWFDSSDLDDSGSSSVNDQKTNATYNVDVYACGVSVETSEGHSSGDESSAIALHAAIRNVRNILMSGYYTYLDLRGVVWGRKVTSVNIFQPAADDATMQNIIGARISFRVTFTETAPQVEGAPLELIAVQVKRAENGEILLQMEYQDDGS